MSDLPARLGHAPTIQEIAERIEATDEEVLEAMHAAQGHHAVSLDATSAMGDGDEPGPLRDRIGEEDLSFETVEYGEAIAPVLEEISERDRKVLHLRFVEDMTQSEIAERVGVSQMHVSRILRATIEKLRQRIPEAE
jgi:RNA polymerase sigma-B factor